jgi:hypothetical protein
VVEGLGLGLCLGSSGQGSLGLGGRGCARQELDLLGDILGQVGKGLADVGRVVVCLVGVLRCDSQQLLVNKLQGIDTLLKLNVVWGQLGLVFGLAELFLDILLGASCKGSERCTANLSMIAVDRVGQVLCVCVNVMSCWSSVIYFTSCERASSWTLTVAKPLT